MITTLLALELIIGFAASSFWSARSTTETLKNLAIDDGVDWSIAHTFYADMGGFIIQFEESSAIETAETTDKQRYFGLGNVWVLNPRQLRRAREFGVITRLPLLSEDELGDKDKGDNLVKTLDLVEIMLMLAQLISRRLKDRPVSQLGVMTLSFAACAVIIYLPVLPSPQGVETPTVNLGRRASFDEMRSIAKAQSISIIMRSLYTIPNDICHHKEAFVVGTGLGAIWFGVLHLIAWDFTFPAAVERKLWRVSSVVTIISPMSSLAFGLIVVCFGWVDHKFAARTWATFSSFSIAAFIVARIFLLVESFRSLYYQPVDVFVSTWAY
ncbi:hypothetical protein PSPO01_09184 [Paraphaeosphaeria sporulosa]